MSTPESFHFPEVRVVEASAGSGKTYALAKRYVQLALIAPEVGAAAVHPILAITFTNKATIEMKSRILEFFKHLALGREDDPAARDLRSGTGLGPAAARQRAFAAVEAIIRQYHTFQVQTIDSFMHAIVAGCAFDLELSARFSVKTDVARALGYSLDWCIERAAADPALAGLFREFLQRYIHVDNSYGWFPREHIVAVLKTLYAEVTARSGRLREGGSFGADDLLRSKRQIFAHLRALNDTLPQGTNATFVKSLAGFLATKNESFSLDDLSRYLARPQFPANKGVDVPPAVAARWDTVRQALAAYARDDAFAYFTPYVPIFEAVMAQFRQLSWKEDAVYLPEINRRAHELLQGGMAAVPELYYRLAVRFRHLLIDEFQDTSGLQWQNLAAMAEEMLASGGSLFYVGDKKQAIYRFRGGDAALFDAIPAQFALFNPCREALRRNYRSKQEVVAFNNEVFSAGNLRRFLQDYAADLKDDVLPPEAAAAVTQVYADAAQEWLPQHTGGRVMVRHTAGDTVEERAAELRALVPGLVRELHARYAYRDIAVLARDNGEIERVTGWLLAAGIPCASDKTLNVRENPLIKELFSFLQFLHTPIDDLAFASFASGAVFAAAAGLDRDDVTAFFFSARATRGAGYLYRAFRDRYPAAWDAYIDEFFTRIGFMPLYELTVSMLEKLRVMEHFPEQQSFVMHFLELITAREKETPGAAAFIAYFMDAPDEDLFVTATATEAVRLLTIHKAKGLEFPCVVIPSLEMSLSTHASGGASFDTVAEGDSLRLVRLSAAHARFSEEIARLEHGERLKTLIDELNAVYVALTRARDELYAFVPRKASSSRNAVRYLIPAEIDRGVAGAVPPRAAGSSPAARMPVPVAAYRDWVSQVAHEFRDDAGPETRESRSRGEALHVMLAQIGNLDREPAGAAVERVAAVAAARYPHRTDIAELMAVVRRLVDGPETRALFHAGAAAVSTEQEVVDARGATHRIDRLVVDGHRALVVDYKTSRSDTAGHQAQVRAYMQLVAELYPAVAVAGIVVYLDECTGDEVTP